MPEIGDRFLAGRIQKWERMSLGKRWEAHQSSDLLFLSPESYQDSTTGFLLGDFLPNHFSKAPPAITRV